LYKENVSKVSMDLDSNNNQDKDREVEPLQEANMNYINKNQEISILIETHKRRKKEDSKSPIELDINSDQDEIKSEEKLDQRTENIANTEKNLFQLNSSFNRTRERVRKNLTLWDVPNRTLTRQIRKNLSYYGRAIVKGCMANGKSKAV
ncbi:12148_t:CDS:1, partial [Gigaspora margarita]